MDSPDGIPEREFISTQSSKGTVTLGAVSDIINPYSFCRKEKPIDCEAVTGVFVNYLKYLERSTSLITPSSLSKVTLEILYL